MSTAAVLTEAASVHCAPCRYDTVPGTGYGVRNLFKLVTKEIKMEGMLARTGLIQPVS